MIMSEFDNIIDIDVYEEVWGYGPPKMGDHIRVKRVWGVYAHHGIYVSDNEVIHFTGRENDSIFDWSKPEVIVSDLDYFLRGGELEVKEYTEDEKYYLYPVENIVSYARACIGDKGYNLVFNNCEHFANMCTLGKHRSGQVNGFILGKKENINMGFLRKIWNGAKGAVAGFIGGYKGTSGNTVNTSPRGRELREPDKVKIAEIEADIKIRLANKERERIELVKQARIDILEFELQSQMDIEKARIEGNLLLMNALVEMQEKINIIAQKRLEIIENGSLSIIRDIEKFYDGIRIDIEGRNDEYNTKKLPMLLEQLEKYDPVSSSHRIFEKRIMDDMDSQKKYFEKQMDAVFERQNIIIGGFIDTKEKVLLQATEITAGFIETTKEYAKQLAVETVQALPMKEE